MNSSILHIQPEDSTAPPCKRILNFNAFLRYIKKVRNTTNSHKKSFFDHVVEQFEKHPELLIEANPEDMQHYQPLLELIYNSVSKMIEDEEVNHWALGLPMKPTVFYSTNAFFKLVETISPNSLCTNIGSVRLEGNPVEFVYAVVLEQYYGIQAFFDKHLVHSVEDPETGLTRYYEACVDTRFIDIIPERELPELKFDMLHSSNYEKDEKLKWIMEMLPLDMFRFEGFGITTINDVSVKYALENIRNYLIGHNLFTVDNYFEDLIHWLKIIMENNDIEFGVLPALYVNNKLVFNEGLYINSVLVNSAKKNGMNEDEYLRLIDEYFKKPKTVFFSNVTGDDKEKHPYLKFLVADGIYSYALMPIYFGTALVGVLEIYAKKQIKFDGVLLSRLEPVIPLLSQLLKNGIHEFDAGIEKIIKDKFTSVQPSVQWKFNEAAWHFIRDKHLESRATDIEDIYFDNVYPLYGAIDIRNSTVERNLALNMDMHKQFTILLSLLEKLKKQSGFGLIDEKIYLAKRWLTEISDMDSFNQHINLIEFLENNITPFLTDFRKGHKWCEQAMKEYFDAINDETGIAFENRRLLERSMNKVISAVNNYLDKMQDEIQLAYPCYFEKFRTDGVEYDIYIGQSIAPDRPFSDMYLKNLRLLQLSSMATIAKFAAAIVNSMPVKVQTTQLIFIHSQSIDIKFRTDEKRFDVEGSYNIRYHVVKKRIDKVLIKDSTERLTQPGKIAMVYINQQDANEYINYVSYLQGQNILCDDLEELELEELQGVNGLKALRVGVVVGNDATKETIVDTNTNDKKEKLLSASTR